MGLESGRLLQSIKAKAMPAERLRGAHGLGQVTTGAKREGGAAGVATG